jgi:hypothetical protein
VPAAPHHQPAQIWASVQEGCRCTRTHKQVQAQHTGCRSCNLDWMPLQVGTHTSTGTTKSAHGVGAAGLTAVRIDPLQAAKLCSPPKPRSCTLAARGYTASTTQTNRHTHISLHTLLECVALCCQAQHIQRGTEGASPSATATVVSTVHCNGCPLHCQNCASVCTDLAAVLHLCA